MIEKRRRNTIVLGPVNDIRLVVCAGFTQLIVQLGVPVLFRIANLS
jgi:hypothetical protein